MFSISPHVDVSLHKYSTHCVTSEFLKLCSVARSVFVQFIYTPHHWLCTFFKFFLHWCIIFKLHVCQMQLRQRVTSEC